MVYKNAIITSTKLGYIQHRGIMTFWIFLDYGGQGQVFGGYCLDGYDDSTESRVQSVLTGDLVFNLLDTLGLDSWEDLKGTVVRAILDEDSFSGKVLGLAHFIQNKEFNFVEHIENKFKIKLTSSKAML